MAVSTRVTLARSGDSVSMRWAGPAKRNNSRTVKVGMSVLLMRKAGRPSEKHSASRVRRFLLGGTILSNGGPLRDSVEHHLTVSNFTSPVAEREGVDSAHVVSITNDIAVAF